MENRFTLLRWCLLNIIFSTFFLLASNVQAQIDFTFSYTGTDTLYVDDSCTAILDWGAPGSVNATCNNPGCVITSFEVFSITDGYVEGDSIPGGMNVLITYLIEDNQGNDAFFGFDIDIIDTIPPVFDSTSLPISLDVLCLNQLPAVEDIIATDNCPPANVPAVDVVINYEGQSNTIPLCEAGTFTRTWTATDEYGNSTQYVQNVNVSIDTLPPVITGFPESLTESCDTADYIAWLFAQRMAFIATDASCGIDTTYDDAPAMFTSACDSVTVTFTATDACGLQATSTATYTVIGDQGPVISPPALSDITLECINDPSIIIDTWSDSLMAIDICDTLIWFNNFNGLTGGCGGNTGSAAVIYTAIDNCGHRDSVTINFTVEDNTPPNIDTSPMDTTVACDGMGNSANLNTWLNNIGGAIASDICTASAELSTGFELNNIPVSITEIQDSLNTQLLVNCGGSIAVTFTFTDVCDNTSRAEASFAITDTNPPVWTTLPQNEEVECDGSNDPMGMITIWLNANGTGMADDDCGSISYSHNFSALSEECGETGSALVTFTATDNCGNTSTQVARISVVDNSPPTWDTPPADLVLDCNPAIDLSPAINTWLMANGNGMASDACSGGVIYSNDYSGLTAGTCGATAGATVTFTATDSCGLMATQIASINIIDTIGPIWTDIPDDLSLPCDNNIDPALAITDWLNNDGNGMAEDACSDPVIITHDYIGLNNGCGGTTGSTTVTFTATDACGNTSEQIVTAEVVDNTPPVWDTDPTSLLLDCDGLTDIAAEINTWLMANGNGTASDMCGAVIISNDYNGADPGCTPMDAVLVIFTAIDECTNAAIRTATITIIDADAPSITVSASDITVDCDNPVISFADWLDTHGGAEASDGCYTIDNSTGSTDWVASPMAPNPDCGGAYSRVVEFTVSDNCGNTAVSTSTYTVEDNTNPVFTIPPAGISEGCGGDDQMALNAWIDDYGGAMITDGCGTAFWFEFDYTTTDGSFNTNIPFGTYSLYPSVLGNDCDWSATINFRIIDDCNKSNEAGATFSIIDTIAPDLFNIPKDITVNCISVPAVPNLNAIDNCDAMVEITVSADTMAGTCPVLQVITRTWVATDDCNNQTTAVQVITVEDRDIPVLVGVPMNEAASCDKIPKIPMVTATDSCDSNPTVVLSESDNRPNDGSCGDYNYLITRMWTATDACGNSSTASQEITISDTKAPTFTVPADISLNCDQGTDPTIAGQPTNLNDNCDPNPIPGYTDMTINTGCNSFIITRTWTLSDACGNVSPGVDQMITITDSNDPIFTQMAQDMDLDCADEASAEAAFSTWLSNYGEAIATDNCTLAAALTWFAAVPGSYDVNDPMTFPGTSPGILDAGICPAPVMGLIRFETVDFVVYDACGNAISTQATFSVLDNTPPTFDYCPEDITIAADPGVCEALVILALPIISDACQNISGNVSVNTSASISSATPGNTQISVDPVTLTFGGLPTPLTSAVAPVSLSITLNEIDAEQATEYFEVLGEDGSLLGQTLNSATQCGTVTTDISIPSADFNIWVSDGELTITLSPNIPVGQSGDFAINDICPTAAPNGGGSSVDATLTYNTSLPDNLITTYAINGAAPVNWNPVSPIMTTLPEGDNDIVYTATDCAGNQSTCAFTVTIVDQEAPNISCPADTVLSLDPNADCNLGVQATLALPSNIEDNCAHLVFTQTQPFNLVDALLSFTFDPNYQNYIADDKVFNFVATAANAVGSTVTFTVKVEGDVEDSDEYFVIYGEDGSVLGITEASQGYVSFTSGDCMAMPVKHAEIIATIPVSVAKYNDWAADGVVTITAVSNTNFSLPAPGGPSDGINPSCTTFAPGSPDGQTDGASNITIQLDVNTATPYYYTTGATNTPNIDMLPPVIAPTLTFAAGETNVFYVVKDVSGNEDTCSFLVTVEDNTPPIANCQSTTIFVNPSGQVPYTLDPLEINMGSTDNCGIAAYSISPDTFYCSQAGTSVNVTLTVTDGSGNTSQCNAIVAVESEGPAPSYSIGLCGNDTLYLFANPPAAPGAVVYTYLWSGPNGFVSTLENPFIPNVTSANSGTYSVQIEGLTGCTALGVVEVLITDTPNTPIISVNSNMLCTTEDLVLTTQQYSGNNVAYHWYAGIYPGGTFIATTGIPTHTLLAPLAPVTNTYFVIVEVDGCASDASFFATVEVTDTPMATTNDALIQLCEGETFTIGTSATGAGYTYSWTGPNGFISDQANPPAFTNANTLQAGVYELVVSANACPSNAATTLVNVTPQPARPVISSPGLVCDGGAVTFTANITGADFYGWVAPDFTIYTTSTNTYTIPAAALTDAGSWSVFINIAGCNSENALPVMLFVEPPFTAIAINDGPVCEGTPLQLSANTIPGATYIWSGPDAFVSLMQNPIVDATTGTYSVTITASSGCTNIATTDVSVNVVPVIDSISNSAPSCVTGLEDITLAVDLSPADPGNYTYQWTGPNGFSSISNPAIIPNADVDDNGAYIVVVTTDDACVSLPMETIINVSQAPATPMISGDFVFCEGESILLTTTAYSGIDIVYNWLTPNGPQMTTIPSLLINNSAPIDSGTYQVFVMLDACPSNLSSQFEIDVKPNPETPIVTTNAIVCIGETIELETEFISGATYIWSGPAGFSASVFNPVIFDATEDNEGAYTVQLIIDGCISEVSIPVNVQITEAPAVPTALNDGPLCIDAAASLLLSVSSATATPGATYTWYDASTNDTIAGPSASLTALISDFSAYGEGIFDFYVVAEVNGCASLASIPTSVEMNAIPAAEAFAGDPIRLCDATSATLAAEEPSFGSGMWTQLSGPTANIANPSAANTNVGDLQSDEVYIFLWTLSNGACIDYSSDQVMLTVDGISEEANAGLNIELCNVTSANLAASPSAFGAIGMWSQTPAQQTLGVIIDDPADPNTSVSGLTAGETYEFIWTLSNPGCGAFSSASVLVSIDENSSLAFAGTDFDECGAGIIQLNADTPSSGQGTWSVEAQGLTIIDPNNPNTTVQGFTEGGIYTFVWTLDNGVCGFSTDQVVVTFESAPLAADDVFEIPFAGIMEINVKGNDEIEAPFAITLTTLPEHGQLSVIAPGEFVYAAHPTYAGEDEFTYAICSQACPEVCSSAKVKLIIGEDAECNVPSIFTPNGDLVNDHFIIPCLASTDYPENVLSIFNQWGDEVFRASPYNNDWEGTYKGEELPVGTYYYIIDFGQGQEPKAGFLVLER